ncbi:MAG TPA: cytochrome c-type biogenesis protein [bacterium]
MFRFACVLAVVCLSAAPALAAPSIDDQVQAVAAELMCPTCAGQTVAESNAPLAQQMKQEIRERLLRGESRQDILAFFVGQFGESVLAAPPPRGLGLVVWLAPLAVFVIGVVILARFLSRARVDNAEAAGAGPGP